MTPNPNNFEPIWLNRYQGIYRVNMLLETIDRCKDFKTEDEKKKIMGEAHFLRALYYWDLVQLFETVPLTLKTEPENLPRATVEEIYAQMGSDMVKAIEYMPSVTYNKTEPGRATRWAAEGYLARIFLFYTGFYQKESMPLNDGMTLTKAKWWNILMIALKIVAMILLVISVIFGHIVTVILQRTGSGQKIIILNGKAIATKK